MNQDLTTYYSERAAEYDKVYQIPEEQEDLSKSTALFQHIFANKSVLEIACGTGYWTEQIAKTANSILATDINKAVIDIARSRQYNNNVTFKVADMYSLTTNQLFDGLFGGFIWSHILLQDLDNFIFKLKDFVSENGEIVFIDSKQVEGTNHDKKRITRIDQYGNTYQTRKLENGTINEVLKNFPKKEFLTEKLSYISAGVNIIELEHYWIATCKMKKI